MKAFMQPKAVEDVTMESMEQLLDHGVDITGAAVVELAYVKGSDGESVLWVNVNGICAFRVCQIKELIVRKV